MAQEQVIPWVDYTYGKFEEIFKAFKVRMFADIKEK